MRSIGVLFLLLTLSVYQYQCHGSGFIKPHIVGGEEAKLHAYPYQVALNINRSTIFRSFCGGSLLSSEWILTAAHCIKSDSDRIVAIFGAHRRDTQENSKQVRVVDKVITHPEYEQKTFRNDIALLKVTPVILVNGIVQPIRLPSESQRNLSFWKWPVTITGWGHIKDGSMELSPVLRTVSSTVVTNFYCKFRFFTWNINENNICASGSGKKSTCQGDSGGPMVITEADGNYTLIGVTSFVAHSGCEKSFPFGFTRVTSYLNWIYNETGIKPRL